MSTPLPTDLRVWIKEGFFHCSDGAGEFVREATSDEKLLWSQVERLRKALSPFATAAIHAETAKRLVEDAGWDVMQCRDLFIHEAKTLLSVAHFREALSALEKQS